MLNPLSPKKDSVIPTGLLEISSKDSGVQHYCGERAASPIVTKENAVKGLSKDFKVKEKRTGEFRASKYTTAYPV